MQKQKNKTTLHSFLTTLVVKEHCYPVQPRNVQVYETVSFLNIKSMCGYFIKQITCPVHCG